MATTTKAVAAAAAAKQSALAALQSTVKAKTTGTGTINTAATAAAAQTAINLSNQAVAAQQATTDANAANAASIAEAQAAAAKAKADADAAAAQIAALTEQNSKALSAQTLQQAQQNITNQNALQLMQSALAGYGVDVNGDISNAILGLTQKNYDAATITALVQSPTAEKSSDPSVAALAKAWNTRFAGNVAREKAGLTPLSPADYINTENSYKAVMQRAGLDAAHMDQTKLAALIGADVSPSEVNQRVNAAMTALTSEDPYVVQQLQQQFNLTNGDLVGHLLDPVTQASVIQNKVTAAQIGAEAARAGADVNAQYSYQLANQGITQQQAQQGFQSIAQQLPGTQALASRYQGYINEGQAGQALQTGTFGAQGSMTQAQAEAELKRLQTQEVSAFSGSSGAGKGSLQGTTEGLS
jgi:hypothetical protein